MNSRLVLLCLVFGLFISGCSEENNDSRDAGLDAASDSDADADGDIDTDTDIDTDADTSIDAGSDAGGAGGDASDSTWTDPSSGLKWQNPPDQSSMTWQEAKDHCANLTLDGSWRLPTIDELRSLIRGCAGTQTGGACGVTDRCLESTCWSAPCEECSGLEGPGAGGCYWDPALRGWLEQFWSSSSLVDHPSGAWFVSFVDGSVGSTYKKPTIMRAVCILDRDE